LITVRKPVITEGEEVHRSFKLREGMSVGCMVTLRRERMYEFYRKLVTIVLPRVRDFKGVSPNLLMAGELYPWIERAGSFFPEIEYDKIDKTRE